MARRNHGGAMIRRRTLDLQAPEDGRTVAYTQEQLGPNRALLPNGNLICYSVPLARTGWLIYGPQEVPVAPGERGVAYVERTADTLFAPQTIASFQGAALTIGHPTEDVDPNNWERLAGGYTINVRRGTGDDADVLLGDIIVTRKRFIDAILAGLMEVSPGYDADYRDNGGGLGSQHNILGNHVALVKKGRCGPRCAIGDAAFQAGDVDEPETQTNHHQESYSMPAANQGAPLARRPITGDVKRRRVLDAQAELEAAQAELDDGQEDGVHVHVHNYGNEPPSREGARTTDAATEERFVALEGDVGEIKGLLQTLVKTKDGKGTDDDGDEDDDGVNDDDDAAPEGKKKGKKTGDSAALATGYTELASQAEILQPGFKVPTFDAEMTRSRTVDRMCAVRRKVLDGFTGDAAGAAILQAVNGGTAPDLLGMDCAGVASLFKNAAVAKAAANHASTATRDAAHQSHVAVRSAAAGVPSIATLNAQNAKFWEGK
ncbi:hypothetical protein D3C87_1034740 [compost metagenome]